MVDLYEVQKDFIKKARHIIEDGKVGLLSSPTGTGKTLSLLCSIQEDLSLGEEYAGLSLYNMNILNEKKTIVFYCSRTHSQLNQAINELKKMKIKTSSIVVGSRKIYCINKDVNKIKDSELINEKCSELGDKCIYYKDEHVYPNVIGDIEEIRSFGIKHNQCPYYLARNYSQRCEIVFLPYNLLSSKEGRRSANIDIRNSIVIIDEAHNIYESIIQINTVSISFDIIRRYLDSFDKYRARYENRMSEENASKLGTVIIILKRICAFHERNKINAGNIQDHEEYMSVDEFLVKSELTDFNMIEVEEYVRKSKLAHKLEGFNTNLHSQLFSIARFLLLLTLSDENGRIFFDNKKIRFTPLDPRMYIEDMMESRSIILAGGTMEPIDHLLMLFGGRECEYYSFKNVCNNFVSFILGKGPSEKEIKLNYESRESTDVVKDVMGSIFNLSNAVKKGGVICFVPSKKYIGLFKEEIKRFRFLKKIMFDDSCGFEDYSRAVKKEPCILFSVMGGRLSEGINFNDDLCRLLMIIGVPYPTPSVEMKERIKFYGNDYSTLIAMKTVNQSLGRALRHKDDYSAIVLIDVRYKHLFTKISPWIQEKTRILNFPAVLFEVNKFLNG
jgi:chromosome transmission fidelity protein 1